MAKELSMIGQGFEPAYKEQFLQHISDLVNFDVSHPKTYNDLFASMRKWAGEDVERNAAVEDFIAFQHEGRDPEELLMIFQSEVVPQGKFYLHFDYMTVRENTTS